MAKQRATSGIQASGRGGGYVAAPGAGAGHLSKPGGTLEVGRWICNHIGHPAPGPVAKSVDAPNLKFGALGRAGSIPAGATISHELAPEMRHCACRLAGRSRGPVSACSSSSSLSSRRRHELRIAFARSLPPMSRTAQTDPRSASPYAEPSGGFRGCPAGALRASPERADMGRCPLWSESLQAS